LLGAIIGDIIGSPYEFDWNNNKSTDFPLIDEKSHFTDDTVMTIAVAEGLMDGYGDRVNTKQTIISAMKKYGRMYPNAGYGGQFSQWLNSKDTKPYNSFGNGSAMRVSAVAWTFDDLAQVEEYAAISARVTHNHPEGIKGAKSTAAAIFLARKAKSKLEIKKYIETTFQYDLRRTLAEIRPGYHHIESCMETVPEAITAFLESDSFEDAIRKAVSLGGDSDTLAAITGSIAEAFYGINPELIVRTLAILDRPLLDVVNRWRTWMDQKHKNCASDTHGCNDQ
jgi:ADP-ribosylglycohydrolase